MGVLFAIVQARLRLLWNRATSRASKLELLLGAFVVLLGVLASLGVATIVGALLHSTANHAGSDGLRNGLLACFGVAGVTGLLMPILLSSGASGLDTSQLVLFPIRRRRLFLLSWISAFLSTDHVAYYPILAAGWLVLHHHGRLGGPGGTLAFLLILVNIVTWSFALLAFIQGVMKHRRSKEIAGMVGFSLFLVFSLLPSLLAGGAEDLSELRAPSQGQDVEAMGTGASMLEGALDLLAWTPPGLAADAIASFEGFPGPEPLPPGSWMLGLLALWFAVGLGLAYGVFRWRMHSNLGLGRSASGAGGPSSPGFDVARSLPFLPADLVGLASRELRYVFRSSVGKLNLLLVPLVCGGLLFALGRGLPALAQGAPSVGLGSETSVLFGLTVYGLLFTNNFVNNAVGWEGVGFKTYLLAPVPLRRVLIGKNLGIGLYGLLLYGLVLGTWSLLRSVPSPEAILQTLAFFCGSLLLFMTSGNFASILFPIPRDISAMKSQPSHPAVLCSLLTVLCLVGIMLLLVALSATLPWLPLAASMGLFALGALGLYWVSLPIAARLFYTKSEAILAKLEAGF